MLVSLARDSTCRATEINTPVFWQRIHGRRSLSRFVRLGMVVDKMEKFAPFCQFLLKGYLHGLIWPLIATTFYSLWKGRSHAALNVTADSVSFIFCDHGRLRYVQLLVDNSPNRALIRSPSLRNWRIEYCFLLSPRASYRVEK